MGTTASHSMAGTSESGAGADRAAKPPSAAALIHLIAICSALLMGLIVAGTVIIIINLRARAVTETQRQLRNMGLVRAEQIDRSFEAVALVESGLVERMNRLNIVSADKLRSEMS